MNDPQRSTRWPLAAAAGVGLVAIGLAMGALLWRDPVPPSADMQIKHVDTRSTDVPPAETPMHMPAPAPAPAGGSGAAAAMPAPRESVGTLTADMMTRAGIRTVAATEVASPAATRSRRRNSQAHINDAAR